MNELIKRVKNIQNKAKSLQWGSCMTDDESIVFAVGHKSYAKKTVYFKVRLVDFCSFTIDHLKENGAEVCIGSKCGGHNDIIKSINTFLAKEFPPIVVRPAEHINFDFKIGD